ncbi:hypothetical protein GPECTOR_28g830 [Gonium pectorale]|uniref:CNNM transmembrane domain-containing protein n=1 Tax=Gonium pectorale TaxID=33097 RepID=A0A150GF06_GONPE|nr:hypothetical protein GPECTOR_28g830 [Gonium pectorale]|eukprot:KXZ48422.1 hypothetical protein GPECTOR_28g830 [Gonium pectorale]
MSLDTLELEALPLFIDRLANPVAAVILSVSVVLVFGEIIPQAVCSRYGLRVGAYSAWFVRVLMTICSPIAWPIGKLLDFLLGPDHSALFRRAQLKALVDLHGSGAGFGGTLSEDEVHVIRGALDLTNKVASKSMTPLDKVFMLSTEDRLDERTLQAILMSGHSRIPVHREGNRKAIIGLILVKELVLVNPADVTPVSALRLRELPRLAADTPMYDMLKLFETGKSHMAVLTRPTGAGAGAGAAVSPAVGPGGMPWAEDAGEPRRAGSSANWPSHPLRPSPPRRPGGRDGYTALGPADDYGQPAPSPTSGGPGPGAGGGPGVGVDAGGEPVGIITIEDVIEELLQEEIIDETDLYIDNMQSQRVNAAAVAGSLPPRLRQVLSTGLFTPRVGRLGIASPRSTLFDIGASAGGTEATTAGGASEAAAPSFTAAADGHASAANLAEIYIWQPVEIRAVVAILNMSTCGAKPGWSVTPAVSNFFSTCSYNKTVFLPDSVPVVGPLELPCNGTTKSGVRWSATGDRDRFLAGVAEAAEALLDAMASSDAQLAKVLQPGRDRRYIFVMPQASLGGSNGMSGSGPCVQYACRMYMTAGAAVTAADAAILTYHLMFTMGLGHADKGKANHDKSDPMGFAAPSGLVCLNGPNAYRLGWSRPVGGDPRTGLNGSLTAAGLWVGRPLAMRLPAASVADNNTIVVSLGPSITPQGAPAFLPSNATQPQYFLTFRARGANSGAFDGGLAPRFRRKVLVHALKSLPKEPATETSLLAVLQEGESWESPFVPFGQGGTGGRLHVRVTSAGAKEAAVQLCRAAVRSESVEDDSCYDGLDNDCDGLVDEDDPDCRT